MMWERKGEWMDKACGLLREGLGCERRWATFVNFYMYLYVDLESGSVFFVVERKREKIGWIGINKPNSFGEKKKQKKNQTNIVFLLFSHFFSLFFLLFFFFFRALVSNLLYLDGPSKLTIEERKKLLDV